MKIANIETMVFENPKIEDTWHVEPANTPYTKYGPQYKKLVGIRDKWGAFCVKVTTDDGTYGYGTTGTYNQCGQLIDEFFKPLLIGENPFEIEKLWDLMFSGSMPFGRRGAALMAISAIDIALWEILGKTLKVPVYTLLGGKVRDKIPCYGTGPQVALHKEKGYFGSKIPIPYGPEHGKEGMNRNEARVREVREIMGPDGDIMCDCWCGWDHNYTVKMAQRLKDYNIKWIEEPLMPDDFEGFTRLRKILNPMGILLTTGEHEHSRWGIRELIDRGCADIVQCDTEYVGGVSELKKIMGYAAAHGVTVVPHTPNVPGMHVVFNSTASPFMERITHNFDHDMFITDYVDKDGYVTLSDSPGYGIELNPKYTRRIK